ncbi:NADP(H)-dependent aldo-keto reductase [Leeia sp. TBRC 13508]|uniref:NADP(H)-dependent aldo-keto reductase n=1 Tax=Leeia speluncae TaxID=2884804 RepID=A0ABS8D6W7_9NEIS|nr:NADP(H)-dependent aldo-keto reductase [Leeia speluncae]MCB6183731.1 NADP(H)-dependent aldo-keto reductase [Leeia speluncae]
MQYKQLGTTDVRVSLIGLGTMTWGEQNTLDDAHSQITFAKASGINLIDVAEMYPVPPKPETQGATEKIVGEYFAKFGDRQDWILATKATGPAQNPKQPGYVRNGELNFNLKNLSTAVEGSLKRLQTDYIDLYQLHWPDRKTNMFGQLGFKEEENNPGAVAIEETLYALSELVKSGKIRYVGVSNETPWGVAQFLKYADKFNLPRIVSIQNPYNLLNRSFEVGLSEFSYREQVGLLAYSPLAFGVLSGKYLDGQKPDGARLTLFERFSRYTNPQATAATAAYAAIAKQYGLSLTQMSLAFINQRPFVSSNLIGATNIDQLKENIESVHITLSEEILQAIEAVHTQHPNPAP